MCSILNWKSLLLAVVLTMSAVPAQAQGLIPWTYNSVFGTGPTYWGSYYPGSYGTWGANYGTTAFYSPYVASYGSFGYSNCGCNTGCSSCGTVANYAPACGCNNYCGCSTCGYANTGCGNCGCADCGNGCSNCANPAPVNNNQNNGNVEPTYRNQNNQPGALPKDQFERVPPDRNPNTLNNNNNSVRDPAFERPLAPDNDLVVPNINNGRGADGAPLKFESEVLAQVKPIHQRTDLQALELARSLSLTQPLPLVDRDDLNVVVR